MIDLQLLFSFIAAVFLLAIAPGPDNIYVAFHSLKYGFKSGCYIVLGLMTGCLFHSSLLALGFSVFLSEFPLLFSSIKLLGAAYLIYLAYSLFRRGAPKNLSTGAVRDKKPFELFKQGLLMNLLNPKVSMFFLALFPGFLFLPGQPLWVQFMLLGFVFILVSTLVFSAIALLASRILNSLNKPSSYFLKAIHWTQIALFIGMAFFLFLL